MSFNQNRTGKGYAPGWFLAEADCSRETVQVAADHAQVITAESFRAERNAGPVLVIGDGAGKCRDLLAGPQVSFVQACPTASGMLQPALREFEAAHFRDTAYFEPFYLKDFVATVSRKKLF